MGAATSHRREKPPEPLDELRRTARRLGSERTTAPIVAGPWRADEVGELLYWIPFLRWAQVATFELRDRLVVVARASTAAWYRGVGRQVLAADHVDEVEDILGNDLRYLPASLVEERRSELSRSGTRASSSSGECSSSSRRIPVSFLQVSSSQRTSSLSASTSTGCLPAPLGTGIWRVR